MNPKIIPGSFSPIDTNKQTGSTQDGKTIRSAHPHHLESMEENIKTKVALEKALYYDEMVPTLLNKRGFKEKAERELKNYEGPFAIIYFDGDHFKNINDTLGHAVGDDVIKAIGKAMGQAIEKTSRVKYPKNITAGKEAAGYDRDLLCRRGGDEFSALLLPRSKERWTGEKANTAAVKYIERINYELSKGIKITDATGKEKTLIITVTSGFSIGMIDKKYEADQASNVLAKTISDADKKMLAIKNSRGVSRT